MACFVLSPDTFAKDAVPVASKADAIDFGGGDPRRFLECETSKGRVAEMVCRVGAAAYATAFGLASSESMRSKDKTYFFAGFAALEAMTMTQTVQSGARYSFDRAIMNRATPAASMEECLGGWLGICGNHIELFIHIMRALDIPVRPLQFTYEQFSQRNSHIVAEVFYAGKWQFFDVSNGATYPTGQPLIFMTYDEIRRNPPAKPQLNQNNTWFAFRKMVGIEDMDYLRLNHSGVISDMAGTVRLKARTTAAKPVYTERFDNLWNFIGDNQVNGKRQGISYRINLRGRHTVRVEFGGVGCVDHDNNRIRVGDREIPVSTPMVEVEVTRSFDLAVRSTDDVCYIAIKQMTVSRQPAKVAATR